MASKAASPFRWWIPTWILVLATAAGAQETLTTVILVRHAEKATVGDDPPLTAAGEARARRLVHVLGGLEIAAVYSTPLRRTWQTATPLARALGQEVAETPITDTYVQDVARRVQSRHRGEVVVVVSHSNTLPEILAELGVDKAPRIPDHDYDNLFVVVLSPPARPVFLNLRYGAETP